MVPPTPKARWTIDPELLPHFGINDDGYRPIIDEAHLHVRPEHAGLNRFPQILRQPGHELLVERDCYFRPGGPAVRRSVAFPGAAKKGELADEQDAPLRVLY